MAATPPAITQWYRRQIDFSRAQLIEFMTALVVTTTDITGALERRLTAEDH